MNPPFEPPFELPLKGARFADGYDPDWRPPFGCLIALPDDALVMLDHAIGCMGLEGRPLPLRLGPPDSTRIGIIFSFESVIPEWDRLKAYLDWNGREGRRWTARMFACWTPRSGSRDEVFFQGPRVDGP